VTAQPSPTRAARSTNRKVSSLPISFASRNASTRSCESIVQASVRGPPNARLASTVNSGAELLIDENDDVVVDGRIDDELRELLDDALFAVNLQEVAERHRRPRVAGTEAGA
jgi:hypothetical protein